MSYQALYRVWRPQTFHDIYGQPVITQTLKNAIEQDRISHAYLFTGPRGTGKTSAAKVVAKAINCPYAKGGEPCNECYLCTEITKGALGDVIEIDAASNNGVDEIRDIRQKAQYAPSQALYKVYIIDEVHMLSTGAFNALLKTLEEPPKNVVFILATTEPHKIPLTILSRTQRFDFKRIDTQLVIKRLEQILNHKEVSYDPEALRVIANAAEGGMRDALSLLDQALSFSVESLSVSDALQITGSTTQSLLLDYIEAALLNQPERGLSILSEVLTEGKDAGRFTEDVILMLRDLLVYKQSGDPGQTKIATLDQSFKQLSESLSDTAIYKAIYILNHTSGELRYSHHADIYLEIATIRLTQPLSEMSEEDMKTPTQSTVEALTQQVNQLESKLKMVVSDAANQGSNTPKPSRKTQAPQRSQQEFRVNLKQVHHVLTNATKDHLVSLQDIWQDLIHSLDTSSRAILHNSQPVAASPQGLVVTFEFPILCEKATTDQTLKNGVADFVERLLGVCPTMVFIPEKEWPQIRQNYIKQMNTSASNQKQRSTPDKTEDDNQLDHEQVTNTAVEIAVELFGEDHITIKE